eukprot:CAMPEP_0184969154 /NCGR_PEP_ID=MMETSP1098-20130426/1988_1 /TAXON_ID=89044 /ORGANISM="Spumella elongata, Strain CCAP 955/1" /LENGTH=692 /DNA_ID=CAMNT_0027490891 /DNA_START=155 /DNA_END=2233 /DNA_ORIENTATION=+
MSANYNIDSDSDEDDVEAVAAIANSTTWHLHDIEKLKEQTSELLDPTWKDTRNKHLLNKMLELEQPTITVKMIDFLLQEGVCDSLMSFITLNAPDSVRPAPTDTHSAALKKSYRAVILLSPDNPTEALNSFLSKKAALITKRIFDIFLMDSAGSFYHSYRLLESLLRCYPSEVFEGLCSDGKAKERITNMLRFIGFPPVCELLVMLLALTPVPRTGTLYTACSKNRWIFLDEMNNWNFMLQIAKVVANPDQHCALNSFVNADQHSTAAAQLLQEIIEKISLEESGESLLVPIGSNSEIIDTLMDGIVKPRVNTADGMRRSCARMICFMLRRAADMEILCYNHHPNGAPPSATYVPNRLFNLRESIVNHVRARLTDVLTLMHTFDSFHHEHKTAHKYSNYEVAKPFTSLRAMAIEVIVLMVESEETVASAILTVDTWKLFITWVLQYAHNNVFHALFYRIVFAVLRQEQEDAQRVLFQKAKFASFLIENFLPYSVGITKDAVKAAATAADKDLVARRIACRGLIMNCANAIRLQINSQATAPGNSVYLKNFFQTHPTWKDFQPKLATATEQQLKFGMGVEIDASTDVKVGNERGGMGGNPAEDAHAMMNEDPQVRFAKSLGFYEDAEWTLNRASLGNKDDLVMNRRRSFEEGYGSFSDYQDDSPQVVVDEIDMARKKSPNTSPYGKTPPLPPS